MSTDLSSGSFAWGRFAAEWIAPSSLFLGFALVGGYELYTRGIPALWHGGFLLLIGCLPLVALVLHARRIVVRWKVDDRLCYTCLSTWKSRTVNLCDVSEVVKWETDSQVCCTISAPGAARLWIRNRYLPGLSDLLYQLEHCRRTDSPNLEAGPLMGVTPFEERVLTGLSRGVFVFFLGCPLAVGMTLVGMGLSPRGVIDQPHVFIAAGVGLAIVCFAGIIFVLRDLPPWVVGVRIKGTEVRFRRFGRPYWTTYDSRDIVKVERRLPNTRPRGVPPEFYRVVCSDQRWFDLGPDLPNQTALANAIREWCCEAQVVSSDAPVKKLDLADIADPDVMDKVVPHLRSDESLLWIGRANPELLRNEWIARRVAGWLLLTIAGIGFSAIGYAMVTADVTIAFLLLIPVLLAVGGYYNFRLLTRLRAKCEQMLYAVTNQRAIVVGDLGCSEQGVWEIAGSFHSFDPDLVSGYRLERGERDIVFAAEWRRMGGRRRRNTEFRVDIGFIALGPCPEAIAALNTLIRQPLQTA